jgi:hypothetical protein
MYDLHQNQNIRPTGIIVEGERVYIQSDLFDLISSQGFAFSGSFDGIGVSSDNDTFHIHHNTSCII